MKKIYIVIFFIVNQNVYEMKATDLYSIPSVADALASINFKHDITSFKEKTVRKKAPKEEYENDAKISVTFAHDVIKEYDLSGSMKRYIINLFRFSNYLKRHIELLGYDTRLIVSNIHISLESIRQDQFEQLLPIVTGVMMPQLLIKQLMSDKYSVAKLEEFIEVARYLEIFPLITLLQEVIDKKHMIKG